MQKHFSHFTVKNHGNVDDNGYYYYYYYQHHHHHHHHEDKACRL